MAKEIVEVCYACETYCENCDACQKCNEQCNSDGGCNSSQAFCEVSSNAFTNISTFAFSPNPTNSSTYMGPESFNQDSWDAIIEHLNSMLLLGDEQDSAPDSNEWDSETGYPTSQLAAVAPFTAAEFRRVAYKTGYIDENNTIYTPSDINAIIQPGALILGSYFTALERSINSLAINQLACNMCNNACNVTCNECQKCDEQAQDTPGHKKLYCVSCDNCDKCNTFCENCNSCDNWDDCDGCQECDSCDVDCQICLIEGEYLCKTCVAEKQGSGSCSDEGEFEYCPECNNGEYECVNCITLCNNCNKGCESCDNCENSCEWICDDCNSDCESCDGCLYCDSSCQDCDDCISGNQPEGCCETNCQGCQTCDEEQNGSCSKEQIDLSACITNVKSCFDENEQDAEDSE